ncbi:MAG: GNAT family N-acetyltransferase [Pseudomonadota bacterium]
MNQDYPDRIFDVLIRRASSNDIQIIVSLMSQGALEGAKNKPIPEPLPEGYSQAFQKIEKDPNQSLMVAETNGEVIGTFQLSFLTYLQGGGQEDCQIESVFIAVKWRGKGIGSHMMKWAIEAAKNRNCRRLQLTTHKKRKNAHRFYERLGFELSHEGAKMQL